MIRDIITKKKAKITIDKENDEFISHEIDEEEFMIKRVKQDKFMLLYVENFMHLTKLNRKTLEVLALIISRRVAYGNNEVHLHPYKARRLSVAEALAIQSLPKDFELPLDITMSAKFKTIGNGVPFLAARGVASTLKSFLEKEAMI